MLASGSAADGPRSLQLEARVRHLALPLIGIVAGGLILGSIRVMRAGWAERPPARRLISRAARSLPSCYQARYEEEWLAELHQIRASWVATLWMALQIRRNLSTTRRLLAVDSRDCVAATGLLPPRSAPRQLARRLRPLRGAGSPASYHGGIGPVFLICFGDRDAPGRSDNRSHIPR